MVSRALMGLREHNKSMPYLWYPVLSWGSESTKNPCRTYGIPCSHGAPRAPKILAAPVVSRALMGSESIKHPNPKFETQSPKPDTRKGQKKSATKNCLSFFQLVLHNEHFLIRI